MKGDGHDADALAPTAVLMQRLTFSRFGVFINELSLAPTVLSAGKFKNRDMGGVLQFTTGLGVGWEPRLQSSL